MYARKEIRVEMVALSIVYGLGNFKSINCNIDISDIFNIISIHACKWCCKC